MMVIGMIPTAASLNDAPRHYISMPLHTDGIRVDHRRYAIPLDPPYLFVYDENNALPLNSGQHVAHKY